MKNLINNLYIKTSNKLIISKKNNNLLVTNNSSKREKLIFAKIIITDRKDFVINSKIKTIYGDDCKILNKKLKAAQSIEQNSKVFYNEINKALLIGISFEPNSEYEISEISYELNVTAEKDVENYFKNDILVITPGYPSNLNKYWCGFVHSKISEYQKRGLSVDVAVINDLYINNTEFFEFEKVKACKIGYGPMRLLLLKKHYKKILIHFPVPKFYHILDAVDLTNTQVLLYSHGVDTLYREYDKIGAPYFTNDFKIPEEYKSEFKERDEGLFRYNERPNFKFIFGTNYTKAYSEKVLGIKYKNYEIIPCFIDENVFKYQKKDPELRKKIFVLRPQENLKSYSIDLVVRTILELSHRPFFDDLEFSIYGDGEMHDVLLEPLRDYDNVHIYKKFLTHEEIAKMHKEHGIGLFPSRFDVQAVSACEAAMSGNVVITSKNIGTADVIDPSLGTFCETENYIEYADVIEKLYYDPKLFSDISEKMHKSVMKTCSYSETIKKELEIIKSFNAIEKINIPSVKKNPLLSISIAAYNISDFVIQIICSLLRSKYANELEILVVNDGSKDDTIKKISKFVKNNYHGNSQPVVRIVDKENGGHGSTINKGIELATGKYFRLLDGDDYYITEDFDKYIEKLKHEDSDLVLTNYIEDFSITGEFNYVKMYEELTPGVQYLLDDITFPGYGFETWGPLLHTATYKTKLLKNSNFKIDEHCFYVDMEYNFIGCIMSSTVT